VSGQLGADRVEPVELEVVEHDAAVAAVIRASPATSTSAPGVVSTSIEPRAPPPVNRG
jgi:hypothetical protein